jgi:hypothetical protein
MIEVNNNKLLNVTLKSTDENEKEEKDIDQALLSCQHNGGKCPLMK